MEIWILKTPFASQTCSILTIYCLLSYFKYSGTYSAPHLHCLPIFLVISVTRSSIFWKKKVPALLNWVVGRLLLSLFIWTWWTKACKEKMTLCCKCMRKSFVVKLWLLERQISRCSAAHFQTLCFPNANSSVKMGKHVTALTTVIVDWRLPLRRTSTWSQSPVSVDVGGVQEDVQLELMEI